MVVLDTCVASYLISRSAIGTQYARRFLEGRALAIAETTLKELVSTSSRTTDQMVIDLLSCEVIMTTPAIETFAKTLREALAAQGLSLAQADSRIAATALLEDLVLVTHDADFFPLQQFGLVIWTLLE